MYTYAQTRLVDVDRVGLGTLLLALFAVLILGLLLLLGPFHYLGAYFPRNPFPMFPQETTPGCFSNLPLPPVPENPLNDGLITSHIVFLIIFGL